MKFNTYFLKIYFYRIYKKQYFLHENFVYNYRVLLNFNKMPDLFLYYSFFVDMRNIIKSKIACTVQCANAAFPYVIC